MTVLMQKLRLVKSQTTTYPDCTSEGCNLMKLETMSSLVHIDKASSNLHARTHPRSDGACKPLQPRPLMTHNDHVCVHSRTLLSTSASQT